MKILFKSSNYIFYLLLLVLVLQACSRKVNVQENEHYLYAIDFKGNENVTTETLESLIPLSMKPNTRPLELPMTPRVWWLNFGQNHFKKDKAIAKKERLISEFDALNTEISTLTIERKKNKKIQKLNRIEENLQVGSAWFWRYIGEKPSIVTNEAIDNTQLIIEKYLKMTGYRDAVVSKSVKPIKKKKAVLTYFVKEGSIYKIDSIIYEIQDSALKKVVLKNKNLQLVRKNDPLDINLINAERNRIEYTAKQNGYYQFSGQYIRHGVLKEKGTYSDFITSKNGSLYIGVANPPDKAKHQVFKIERVRFKGLELNQLDSSAIDTLVLNDIEYITANNQIPLKLIDNRMLIRSGSIFNIAQIQETQRQLGLFNQFAFTSYQFNQLNDSTLTLDFFSPLLNKFTVSSNPGLNSIYNNGQNFIGFGIPFSVSMRNSFKKLETTDFSAIGAFEGQPSPINSNKIKGGLKLGTNFSVSFPTLNFPLLRSSKYILMNPKTVYSLGVDYSEPFWGKRFNVNTRLNYSWQPSLYKRFSFSLLDVALINTVYDISNPSSQSALFYNELVRQQKNGNNLKVTFDPQFVSTFNVSYLFNNQDVQERYGNARYFRLFIESGGTAMNLLKNKDEIGLIEQLFPLNNNTLNSDSVRAYFRFVKINADFRKYYSLSPKSGWAYRVNIGVINPYGKNKSVPYEKNFFAGGSNSIRAWSPLSLGVGSAQPDVTEDGNIIPQPGDILLETSIEYRRTVANFFGAIQLATFLDAGNIWKWYEIPTKANQADFDFRRFYKEIAVGSGLGLRWDLTYFILRFDLGIKVFDPSKPEKERFVLDNFSLGKNSPYGLQLQIGIGYPF